jgi:hypothetical protein
MKWEKVYTINEFYDCPRIGITNFNDVPHIYEAILNSSEDADKNRFYLMKVESDFMELVLEAWDIWIKWKDAYDKGESHIGKSTSFTSRSNSS